MRQQLAGTQFCDGLTYEASRCVELPADGGIFGAIKDRNNIFPALWIALLQAGLDLADRLRGEQQATARVVKDRTGDLELASRPQHDLLPRMGVELFWTQNFHRLTILVQAR